MQNKTEVLIKILDDSVRIINDSYGKNPFNELDKALAILNNKNYNQYPSVKNKIGDVIMRVYNTRFENMEIVLRKLDEAYRLL